MRGNVMATTMRISGAPPMMHDMKEAQSARPLNAHGSAFSCWLQNHMAALWQVLDLLKYLAPAAEVLSNRNNHDVVRRQSPLKAQWRDKGVTLIWTEHPAA